MFKRTLFKTLEQWKTSAVRKPLLIRGARQVGKTTLVRQFSESYTYAITLNLERAEDLQFFMAFSDATILIKALFTKHNIPFSKSSETLLFIDEIQASPEAIAMLRYFYEDLPELHLIAAGSLLEQVMRNVKSFPVGRVQYLYLHPFNFLEYLEAKEQTGALAALKTVPVQEYAHQTLLSLFNEYAIVGGMPEVVKTFLQTKGISDLAIIYENIWETYKNDVEKYAHNRTEARVIKHIMATAHNYLDRRIKFQNFGSSNYKSREVGEAFRSLHDAKVIQLIYPCTNVVPPIQTDYKKSPRLQFLDTGLVNYALNIQADMLSLQDLNSAYKGGIIPHLITQELISLNTYKNRTPHFWVREKSQASSEVDLVYAYKNLIIPIEVKSGKVGKLRSLHQFIERASHPYAVRMYAGMFSIEKHKTPNGNPFYLMNLPYYLSLYLDEYITLFINQIKKLNEP